MPHYTWKAITLEGTVHKGSWYAHSGTHLEQLLAKQEMALIVYKERKHWFARPISLRDRIGFFGQLADLLEAGVLLPEALAMSAHQSVNPRMQETAHAIARSVAEGILFADALLYYPSCTNPIITQLVHAGQEGNMRHAVRLVHTYLATLHHFYTRIRSALWLPGITMLFFLGVFLFMCLLIVPRFEAIFSTMHIDLPPVTRSIFALSAWVGQKNFWIFMGSLAIVVSGMWRWRKRLWGPISLDHFFMRMPGSASLLRIRFLATMMHAVAALLQSGLPLAEALSTIKHAMDNELHKNYVEELYAAVMQGKTFSQACAEHSHELFAQDIVAMLEVAEAGAQLPLLLERIARIYTDAVLAKLTRVIFFIQPLCMLTMGLFVALLIGAVYGPLFTISHAL